MGLYNLVLDYLLLQLDYNVGTHSIIPAYRNNFVYPIM